MTSEIKVNEAYECYAGLKDALKQQGFLFLYIGKTLKDIRDKEMYKDLGYEDFKDFLQDPELKQKPSTCYAYIRIYEYYVEKLGLSDSEFVNIGMNRLQRYLPGLKKKDDNEAKEEIIRIGSMTHQDYNIEARENGFDIERPSMYKDNETGKWIIEFYVGTVEKIYNKTANEIIYLDVTPEEIK